MTIAPDFMEVRRALTEIRRQLKPVLSDDRFSTFEIIGAEILNNVVEHGFEGPKASGSFIDVCTDIEAGRLQFCVIDNGKPMPGGQAPQPTTRVIDPTDLDGLPEGGFGWNLIHLLANELTYSREDGKNCLQVAIDL